MAGKNLGKEEYEYQKKRYEMCRNEIYKDSPQVRNFEIFKKRWINFLLLYGLLLTFVKLYVIREVSEIPVPVIEVTITSLTPILICLLCALGSWKLALPLYFLSALYLSPWVYIFINGSSLYTFLQNTIDGFIDYPIQTSLDLCSLIFGILILVTAISLTLVRKNRMLSSQSVELNSQLKKAMTAS